MARRSSERILKWVMAAFGFTSGPFKEDYVSIDPVGAREWGVWIARLQRYRLLWAFYEGTPYSDVHVWSKAFRQTYGLYTWSRAVYSPAYRLGEFWAAHLMGGALDLDAGDGKSQPSALPIITKNDSIRKPISRLWADSNWQIEKEVWTRWGAVLGDVALKVEDDPDRSKVYLRPVSPATLRNVDLDPKGNVVGYTIQELRPDPEIEDDTGTGNVPWVPYTEVCWRDGSQINYQTYRFEELYDWREYDAGETEIGPEWSAGYGFVPMVLVKHINVGQAWGWAEAQPALSRFREIDDLGSTTTDQVRRILNSPWVINARKPSEKLFGTAPKTADEFAAGTPTSTTVVGRDRMTITWIDRDKPVQPFQMVGNMPIEAVGLNIDRINRVIEKEYPELQLEGAETGDSGRARRVARQKAEAKVHARRAAYDDALVRAQMMALSMGGTYPGKAKPYPDYEGISQKSFADGDLAHQIGKRSVFATDPMDEVEEEQARLTALRTAKEAGLPIEVTMRRLGYAETDITMAKDAEQQAKLLSPLAAKVTGNAPRSPLDGQPPAQPSVAPQNRGAKPPTDLQTELMARPGVPFETHPQGVP